MELILEVIIYLLVVLGLITVCFTVFNKFNFLGPVVTNEILETSENVETNTTYFRDKKENEKVTINIRYKNISIDELEKIKESIRNGNYKDIMDIADEVNYFETTNKKNRRKK